MNNFVRLRANEHLRRMFTGAAWTTGAMLLSRLGTFAMFLVVARILDQAAFGRFGIISTTILSFSVIGALGMSVAATKLVAQYRDADKENAARFVAGSLYVATFSGAVLGMAVFLGADWIAGNVLPARGASLAPELRLAAIGLFASAISSAQAGALVGIEAFKTLALLNVAFGVTSFIAVCTAAWSYGLRGAVFGMVGVMLLQCVVQHYVADKGLRSRGIFPQYWQKPTISRPMALGIPAMLSSALVLPATWICHVMLVNQPNGYRQMAALATAEQWFNLVLAIPGILGQVALPVMTNIFANEQRDQSRTLLLQTITVNTVVSLLPLIVLLPLAPFLMGLYGPEYREYWPTFSILVISASLASVLMPTGQTLAATGRLWLGFLMNAGWAIVYVSATYWLVKTEQRGAFGVAMARIGAYSIHAVWASIFMWSVFRAGGKGMAIQR